MVMSISLRNPFKQGGPREAILIITGALVLYFALSLITYDPDDPGWSHSTETEQVLNQGGLAGAWIADLFLYLFGYLAYLFPLLIAFIGLMTFRLFEKNNQPSGQYLIIRGSGFLLTLLAGSGLATTHFGGGGILPLDSGGMLGSVIGSGLILMFNPLGATLLLIALFLTGITLLTGLSWFSLMDNTGRYTLLLFDYVWFVFGKTRNLIGTEYKRYLASKFNKAQKEHVVTLRIKLAEIIRRGLKDKEPPRPRIEPDVGQFDGFDPLMEGAKHLEMMDEPVVREEYKQKTSSHHHKAYAAMPDREARHPGTSQPKAALPSISLLDPPGNQKRTVSDSMLGDVSQQVETKLLDFGIQAKVVDVHPGPVITRFEIELAPGTKVSRITALAKDLARSLSVISVRVVEVIPGKSVIGLELPNEQRDLVRLSEILHTKEYHDSHSPLTLVLGKDISGNPVAVDLAGMPHLLVAGTTGSGKSVAINAMILSLLYKAQPDDVRLIMVDPKMLELSVYEGIPHLLAPVVTDMKEAANALRWCVAEMERRYKLMSTMGVRNIAGFNKKVQDAIRTGKPITDPFYIPPPRDLFSEDDEDDGEPLEPPILESLPAIVVVVDELADMMMVVGKKVEELIARLAQKARASGIHLILATQRPSVDVLTGLIKANIPSRIAFQVSARVDSRTILDQMGAEQLLGHGDMLYLPPGKPIPVRIHGAFVADGEVHNVVEYLREQGKPNYLEELLSAEGDTIAFGAGLTDDDDDPEADPLYDQAVRIVTETRRASISGVQRRLKIGYNRAARMVEQMELAGIVSPLESNGNREVLAPPPPE
ncbi:MAG: DNA translocase FtsK 4TM domain-containing protein [Gammaproteobacteria bacterium]|nr:DNA translocase FtsK 4TM domain-containing protein [Gammaproteobacteria bacterium]NNJ85304.1 cell division protein FtsK [Gammaproteobacteria bacterium]